ncbi:MAG TPA: LacI family DNA-binding transcriptional regulator [Paenibacillus sp.]|nr:LacI family DNA-binding transcriptional regulator [Paenibacillus sp.]
MKVTIKDIASMAGVSISTVSRVINGSKPVNEDVRNRVLEAMRRTNYRAMQVVPGAGEAAERESQRIAVIIPEYSNTVLNEFIVGIHRVAKLYGYVIDIGLTDGTPATELDYLRRFRDERPNGLIFVGSAWGAEHTDIAKSADLPCVLVGLESTVPGIPSVHVDNATASYEAVTYLVQRGHRDIATICGVDNMAVGTRRQQGYRQAMADAGLPVREDWVVECEISVEEGYRAMRDILGTGDRPTAVFCATDLMAIGAMNCLLDQGLRIPEDVSVFGFDGSFVSSIFRPRLTTVEYSATEVGMTAARHLMKLIKGETGVPQHSNVTHYLAIRESTN